MTSSTTDNVAPIERLRSAVPGLDQILGGGLFRTGVYIIQGLPGCGKTILANQICYGHVAEGGAAVYVTLLAESHARMIQHLSTLSFFDMKAFPDNLAYISAFHDLESGGLKGLMTVLRREMRTRKVGVLVLDGLVAASEAAPSDLDLFLRSLPALANHATDLVDHMDQVFSEENVKNFKALLANTRVASDKAPVLVHEIEDLVANLRHTSDEVDTAAADFDRVTNDADIKTSLANIRRISESLASATDRLNEFVTQNEPALSRFTGQGLPELERLLHESRAAVRDIRDLSRSLQQNPGELLYESNYHGVEVPR